jgi:hypothetical protein
VTQNNYSVKKVNLGIIEGVWGGKICKKLARWGIWGEWVRHFLDEKFFQDGALRNWDF